MVIDTMRVVRERKIEITNRVAMNWAVGCAIMHFFGAGVWGFAHTLPQINQWTHGTQVTASHGHFAFFGAYAMLNITMMYFAMPQLRGVRTFDQGLARKAFWFMNFFMILIALALAIAGIVQVYFQRILGMDFLSAQEFMKLWYAVFWTSAWGFAAGVVMFLIDFFRLAKAKA
jgi:nitric oxide reductase subunit B